MEISILLFLTSGLFLGWSLGANDAANVFGTAVGTQMVRFTTAAVVCSLFVILGATISGAGAAHTLGKLGSINALAGSFMAALSAALTVYWMTRLRLPVSTSQAVVGAIIGWNLFSGSVTDIGALTKIVATWFACPLLAGFIAVPLYIATQRAISAAKFHLFRLDAYTRVGLIVAGAFGSYALGANNIANVMGVFVPASPFTDFNVGDLFAVTGIQQLFLIGAIAIAVGVFTYSKRVMLTVGGDLLPLSPVAAWVVVISHSIVLFLFASEGLENLLASAGLPTIPLVPVSSSQAIVGAVVGIGLLRGGRDIKWKVLGNIGAGWVTTPLISAVVCFVALFFLQNVFDQRVYKDVHFIVTPQVTEQMVSYALPVEDIKNLNGQDFPSAKKFLKALNDVTYLSGSQKRIAMKYAEYRPLQIDASKFQLIDEEWLSPDQVTALQNLAGQRFDHKWQLSKALAKESGDWNLLPEITVNKIRNKSVKAKLEFVYRTFTINE